MSPYHHGNLRAELLERAWEVVDRDGLDGLSLRGLSRDIGVSHGASARHFKDRQTLLDALARAGFTRLNAAISTAEAGSFADRLRAAGRAYVSFAVAHPRILDLMYDAKHHPDASAELVDLSHTSMQELIAMISAAQEAGEARAGDAKQLALIVFANVHGVATLATDDLLDGVPWEEAAALTIDFAWRGIAA
ncbi:AcrR family transcriptional regulator [Actinoplanes lutulentus]|uniref:TetR family transcriptional regulator n=1 Tax=Actinoplanes lutulentus TaxID=1287878 RepID=A0A327Z910_9ACTN|nr:TetR/AcrR family transcriptional regulator [Actinoplanes lutulentus]MBB2948532.1 AcrR family transcriptional regulator [Actinoplanes lutulentus]RAK34436.1 TetR family transcriptional regulator [Actinoplanes lutulentus]